MHAPTIYHHRHVLTSLSQVYFPYPKVLKGPGNSYKSFPEKRKIPIGRASKPETAAKRDISDLFAPLALARREHCCARSKQKSLEISSLCGRRFWKERIFVQPRHKTQEILYVFPSILTKDERKSAFPKRIRV